MIAKSLFWKLHNESEVEEGQLVRLYIYTVQQGTGKLIVLQASTYTVSPKGQLNCCSLPAVEEGKAGQGSTLLINEAMLFIAGLR